MALTFCFSSLGPPLHDVWCWNSWWEMGWEYEWEIGLLCNVDLLLLYSARQLTVWHVILLSTGLKPIIIATDYLR